MRRGRDWICAPAGHDPVRLIPHPITLAASPAEVWLLPTIELALDRQALLRHLWGWATTIQAIR